MDIRHLGHACLRVDHDGTSLLLDPDAGTCLVLLTNRVHPDRSLVDLASFRKSLALQLTAPS